MNWLRSTLSPKTEPFVHKTIEVLELKDDTKPDGRRFYQTPSGVWYPSATTVVGELNKRAIARWRGKVGETKANKISSEASSRGTRIHKICEHYINNEVEKLNDVSLKDRDTFQSIRPYVDRINNVLVQEATLYSDFLETAGRTDCIGEYNGKLAIIDFKTSRKPKKREWIQHYFMQEACYAVMFEERTGIPIKWLVTIIAVDKNEPQVYIEKRDDYIYEFICARKRFKEKYNI